MRCAAAGLGGVGSGGIDVGLESFELISLSLFYFLKLGRGIGGLLGPFCLHTLLLAIVDALTRFLYQFQVLLEDDHEIDWIMGVLFSYSNQ